MYTNVGRFFKFFSCRILRAISNETHARSPIVQSRVRRTTSLWVVIYSVLLPVTSGVQKSGRWKVRQKSKT